MSTIQPLRLNKPPEPPKRPIVQIPPTAENPDPGPRFGKGFVLLLLVPVALAVLVTAAVVGVNYVSLKAPMSEVIEQDARNTGIRVNVHYGMYVNPTILVYDLEGMSPTNSKADVFRVLLQYAEKVKHKEFDRVVLAFRGEPKFILTGSFFRQLGLEYSSQNPVYTMRSFAENLFLPSGQAAYGTWTGGILGVVKEQIDDFNDFHDAWYLDDLLKK